MVTVPIRLGEFMINITICDDSEQDIELLKKEIDKYRIKNHVLLNVHEYTNPELLYYELGEGKVDDIYILDVSMPGKDGFMIADEIRKHDENAVIIFLTTLHERAIEGYKSKAIRYILKFNMIDEINEALDAAMNEIASRSDRKVTLQRYSNYWRVSYRDIIYVNRVSRQLLVFTASYGELTDNRGITEFFNCLDDNRFLFIDRSCFVNIDYISQIIGNDIKLKNGKLLPVSRRAMQTVKQKLLEYWSM